LTPIGLLMEGVITNEIAPIGTSSVLTYNVQYEEKRAQTL